MSMKISGGKQREYIHAFCLYSAFRFRSKEKLWKMDENSYFLDMTIYIYIHVGNSQEERKDEGLLYFIVKLSIIFDFKNFVHKLEKKFLIP